MLHALEFIHRAQVIRAGPTLPLPHDSPLALGLQAYRHRIEDPRVLEDAEEDETNTLV